MDMNYRGGNVGGRGWAGRSGVKGGKWDNCNSIINKYIKKKKNESWTCTPDGDSKFLFWKKTAGPNAK